KNILVFAFPDLEEVRDVGGTTVEKYTHHLVTVLASVSVFCYERNISLRCYNFLNIKIFILMFCINTH
ncbi:hypothetical protein, partial [Salmonella sp. s51090]|uniref:hypothetical protein n=1 Tax=Salmonella sp. s51090 TaxID=3159651 RepID=UPI0039801716